jgi:hypothetical protein
MKTELITDESLLDIQRRLRRSKYRLFRAIPRECTDHRGRRVDGWVIMYLEESK